MEYHDGSTSAIARGAAAGNPRHLKEGYRAAFPSYRPRSRPLACRPSIRKDRLPGLRRSGRGRPRARFGALILCCLKWRRRRDSNPRYGNSPYGGLANRWFQPLTHVSECGPLAGRAAYIKAIPKLQPEPLLFGNHLNLHGQSLLLPWIKHLHTKLRPSFLRSVEG